MAELTERTIYRLDQLRADLGNDLVRVRKEKAEALEALARAQRTLSLTQDEEVVLEGAIADVEKLLA